MAFLSSTRPKIGNGEEKAWADDLHHGGNPQHPGPGKRPYEASRTMEKRHVGSPQRNDLKWHPIKKSYGQVVDS